MIKIYIRFIGRFLIIAHSFLIEVKSSNTRKLDHPYKFIHIKVSDLQRSHLIFKHRNEDYPNFMNKMISDPAVVGLGIVDTNLGQIVYSCWIRMDSMYDRALQSEIVIKDDECYFFDAFCVKSHRGKGFHSYMIQERMNHVYSLGKKRAFITIYGFNSPALSVGKTFNYKLVRSVYRYRKGSIKAFGLLLIKKLYRTFK